MIRAWIGLALLSVSWLFACGHYSPANSVAWLLAVVAGASLLSGIVRQMPSRRDMILAAVLLTVVVWFAPWPLRAAPLLIVLGLLFELLPIPRRWSAPLGRGTVVAGMVMLAQAATMTLYARATARSHDLPWPLPDLLAGVVRLLGVEATADGSEVVMYTMRQPHRLAATWDLLIDPATLCFFVGSFVLFALVIWSRLPHGRRWNAWIGGIRVLTLVVLAWLPIRAGLMIAVYIDRVVRWQQDMPLHVMNQFFSPWVLLLLLAGPVLLAWRFVRVPTDEPPAAEDRPLPSEAEPWHFPAGAVLVMLAAAMCVVGYGWDPVGSRKGGRVMVVERHSTWEPTGRPYSTDWYYEDDEETGEGNERASYNYAAIYDYLDQFYEMSRLNENEQIDEAALANCDVLVVKTPTARYSPDEVDAIAEFVEAGGGLLMIGDHTNVFDMGTYLNDIARRFGFTYRHDLLFGNEAFPVKPGRQGWNEQEHHPAYLQLYHKPHVPHPVVQHLPPTDFAVSCSIDPGRSWGRAAVLGTGLWNLPPDYHLSNYHSFPQHRPEMRYGAFIQLWATRPGKGRVLAFTDSTLFSSFCTYQPGKAELMLGMVEWLNHSSGLLRYPGLFLVPVAFLLLIPGLWLARRREAAWLLLSAAAMFGWVLGSGTVIAISQAGMPTPKVQDPIPRIVIDRTASEVPLSAGAYEQGGSEGYGILEQWISKLGYYTTRRSGPEAFSGDALVVICPSRSVPNDFVIALKDYVEGGGKLLVIDSPENASSTANSLLWPFGLSVLRDQAWQGQLSLGEGWPPVRVELAYEIDGGEPCARMGGRPVAATVSVGNNGGQVMAVGCGGVFNDGRMGETGDTGWMTDPDEELLQRYDALFALIRSAVTGKPVGPRPDRTKEEKPAEINGEKEPSTE